jgi:hypothetical protein
MESFALVVEIVLKESELRDGLGYCPEPALWPKQCSTAAMFSHVMQPVASLSPPRSEVLPPRLRFPIPTLEERSLTPALGYVFNKKWLEPTSPSFRSCGSSGRPTCFLAKLSHD